MLAGRAVNVKVKICGNTNINDAVLAARAGADAIGVINVANTPRYVSPDEANRIFRSLPPFVAKVLVVVLDTGNVSEQIDMIEATGANYVQLHGEEPVELVEEVRSSLADHIGIIKKIGVRGDINACIEHAKAYEDIVDAILLDTVAGKQIGGTGKKHDWNISRAIVEAVDTPVILAGGLTPENVADAISKVRPYAVDVSSGVEREPGRKDADKVKRFIEAANYL